MFYHELRFWRRAPNARGCCEARRIIGSAASNADDAARERTRIAAEYKPNQIIELTTREVRR